MRRIHSIFQTGILASALAGLLVLGFPVASRAETANGPSLVISQLKITSSNGQFVTLYNATNNALDMSKYQLEYFNSYDLAKATSSRLIALSGSLPPHSYYMVNDDALLLCYQLSVDSVSLGFSSTGGMVEVLAFNQSSAGGSVTPILQDYVGWSKTAASGAQTLPSSTNAFLRRQPFDAQNNPIAASPGAGSWQSVQPDQANPCNLISTTSVPVTLANGLSQLLPSTQPPATIVSVAEDSATQTAIASLPSADIGLMAPQITELLPNPTGTGNDDSDEYIELYNPNATAFDLSGFSLQTGLTTLHKYTFPNGTSLAPHSFKAFYSDLTALSLSNTTGQAKLLDPFGNSISASEVYGTAKDGSAWALAKGKWYWTDSPTPDKANVIHQPASSKKSSSRSKSGSKASKLKAAGIKKIKKSGGANAYSPAASDAPSTPIHPAILVIIAGLALLYGAYEYRSDLANRVYQLKRNFKNSRKNG